MIQQKLKWVENKLLVDNIRVENDWLLGCIEFFASEHPGISNEGLFAKARDQWLLSDLKEIGEGCLPSTIVTKTEEFTLEHKYPVQLQWLVNIAEPFYDQWRSIYDKKLDDVEEPEEFVQTYARRPDASKKHRTLKLELTDGKVTVTAIEYRHITSLTTKLTPGSKILLTGPIRCVNKILFLEPKNVKILGGEVDTIIISNAYENILLTNLKKPLNPHPKLDYIEPAILEDSRNNHIIPIAQRTPFRPTPKVTVAPVVVPPPQIDAMDDDDFLLGINLDAIEQQFSQRNTASSNRPLTHANGPNTVNRNQNRPQTPPNEFDDYDFLNTIEEEINRENQRMHVDDEIQAESCQVTSTSSTQAIRPSTFATRKFSPETSNIRGRNQIRPVMPPPPDDDFDYLNSIENEINYENQRNLNESPVDYVSPVHSTSRLHTSNRSLAKPPSPSPLAPCSSTSSHPLPPKKQLDIIDHSNLFDSAMDDFDDEDIFEIEDPPRVASILDDDYKFKINEYNLVTHEQLAKFTDTEKCDREFVLFAEIDSIAEKMQIKSNEYSLGVFLKDNSNVLLQGRFHTSVMSKLAGYEPSELQAMRHRKKVQTHINTSISNILTDLKEKLQVLRTFMRIQFTIGQEFPVIVEIIEMTDTNKKILMSKIADEKLSIVTF